MIKKFLTLIIMTSIISAGFLYLGITLMSQYSPAHASSLNALVAETNVQNYTDPTVNRNSVAKVANNSENTLDLSPSIPVASLPSVVTNQSSEMLITTNTSATPITSVKIAELIKNPKQYDDVVFTITGIATALNDEKFLLNDGTGQILVEVEDELISLAVINGISITVIGELDDTDDLLALELDACSLSYQNENVVFDDCIDDDDDMNDDDGMDDDDDDGTGDDDDDDMDDDDDDGTGNDDDNDMGDDDDGMDDDSDEGDDLENDNDIPDDDD